MKTDQLNARLDAVKVMQELYSMDIQSVTIFPKEISIVMMEEKNPTIRHELFFSEAKDLKGWSCATISQNEFSINLNLIK